MVLRCPFYLNLRVKVSSSIQTPKAVVNPRGEGRGWVLSGPFTRENLFWALFIISMIESAIASFLMSSGKARFSGLAPLSPRQHQ